MQLSNTQLKMLWRDLHNKCNTLEEKLIEIRNDKTSHRENAESTIIGLDESARQRRMAQTTIACAFMAQGGDENQLMHGTWN